MTTLYHGSSVEIQQPKILRHLRALDFGSGFYLTSDFHQAEKWAKLVVKRRQQGEAVVNHYIFMPSDELHILQKQMMNGWILLSQIANYRHLQTDMIWLSALWQMMQRYP